MEGGVMTTEEMVRPGVETEEEEEEGGCEDGGGGGSDAGRA